jgi:imidazolonepropionase-like amidohydrolase
MQTLIRIKGLVDVVRQVVVENAYVLTEGTRIVSWGNLSEMPPVNPQATVLDFPGQYLLPGLINCHVHLCLPSAGTPFHHRQSNEMALLTAVRNMRTELESGVTTLRDCGDQNGVLFSLRQAVEAGILSGPRLLLCGPPLTGTGGHAYFLGGEADGRDDLRASVQQRIDAGADFIKLIATGGSTPGTTPALASYTVPQLSAAVAAAHRSGRPVTAHCRGIPGIRNALAAGVDQIEHACFELPDGTLKHDATLAVQMSRAGTFVTPTIQLYRDALKYLTRKQATAELSVQEAKLLKQLPAVIAEKFLTLRNFISLGVKCVAGNDAGLPQTGFGLLWRELDAMVAGGMTPFQAIAAATRDAALAVGLCETIGSIQIGKLADLIVVESDPTQNIHSLAEVSLVMQAGLIVKNREGRAI